MAKEKKERTTLSTYKMLKSSQVGLKTIVLAAPFIPATVITGINWNEWFETCGASLPLGFASLMVTVFIALLGVLKSDTVLKKKDIALYYLCTLLVFLGATNLFLASLFSSLGWMFVFTAAGVLASAVTNTVNNRVLTPSVEFYKGLVEENQLDKKSQKRAQKKQKAQEEARKRAEQEKENIDLI